MPTPPMPLHLTTAASLHQTLASFLVVAFHTILYERSLYPPSTFLLTRAYNFPVRQNRHPKVCRWILDAVSAIQIELSKNTVRRIVFVVYSERAEVLERFVFDVERFPVVAEKEKFTEFVRGHDDVVEGSPEGEDTADAIESEGGQGRMKLRGVGVNVVDVDEQLRSAIRKLAYCGGKLGDLPHGCTYTVVVELRDDAEPPIGHPQPWVPSEPSLQTGEKGDSERIGSDLGGVKTVPVRAVEAGEFIMESWIEEGRAKGNYVK